MNSLLKNQWQRLTGNYQASEILVNEIFDQISKAYNSKSRHYHNLNHISTLLESAEECRNKIADPDSLLFAIWFHDIVYKATASDNEEKSALSAQKFLSDLKVPQGKINKVCQMILATKNHMDLPNNIDSDTEFFLDFDLKILGAERTAYIEYTKQIRQEYRLIPAFLYKPGRKKVLEKFLKADHLYKTAEFRIHEKQARENIQFEIEQL
jgi:predicted metal-dependent HD superfamily phosphohydrolase